MQQKSDQKNQNLYEILVLYSE